jgi:pyrimidine-nucleoside phosphorylase
MASAAIQDGRAWEKFRLLVKSQGGDVTFVDNPELLPRSSIIETVRAPQSGYLAQINARVVGETAVVLGAGRARKEDSIDHAVGIVVHHNVGDYIEAGQALFTLHVNQEKLIPEARQALLSAHHWSQSPVEPLPLFYGVVR